MPELKEVSAEVVAAILFKSMNSKTNQRSLKKMIRTWPKNERTKAAFELKMLNAVAKIFDINLNLGKSPEGTAVLNAFCFFWGNESSNSFGLPRDEFLRLFQIRLESYEKAWKTPHPDGAFFMIGKTFAEFLGEASMLVTFKGSLWFAGALSFSEIREIIKEFRIKPS